MSQRPRPATLLGLLAALLSVVVLSGCTVPAPKGEGPLRYRDQVFTAVTETPNLQYGEAPDAAGVPQKLFLDLYEPAGDTAAKRPAMVWVHGGGFKIGTRKDPMMVELSRRFARRGYVVVSISYRLLAAEICGGEESTEACLPAALKAADDQRAAVRYLRKRAAELRIDPDRIGAGGASAGAISSILVGAAPNIAGNSGNPGFSNAVKAVVSISGGLPYDGVFGPGDAPVLFWHGTADTVVPFEWAQNNVEYMADNEPLGFLRYVNGAGHVPWGQYANDMDEQARNWLYIWLRLGGLNGTTPTTTTPATTTP
ncbi:MAG: alpha/beta hydrolase [Solirubrobacteraceae bacterium]|nr:alpha/beta hydrolase [Solirubrobacteraceae bacterium]